MERKKKRGLVIAGLALVLAAAAVSAALGFFLPQEELKRRFPMWEMAAMQENTGGDADSRLEMRLAGIIDMHIANVGGQRLKTLSIQTENTGTGPVGFSATPRIDYLFRGMWFTVYRQEEQEEKRVIEPGVTEKIGYDIPYDLLEPEGEYRLYVDGVGACSLDIVFPPEWFPGGWRESWWESDTEQEETDDVSMTLAGIDYDVANGDNPYDEIQITLKNNGDEEFRYEGGYEIQYYYRDRWYTVHRVYGPMISFTALEPGEEKEEFYSLPHGFLAKEGKFRVYQEPIGYCGLTEN